MRIAALGSLTLSTLTANNEENEMEKKCTREQKLASMSEIDLERFQIQKRKLENVRLCFFFYFFGLGF